MVVVFELGPALLAAYEDVLGRTELFTDSVLSAKERNEVLDGFLNRCRWVGVFYAWLRCVELFDRLLGTCPIDGWTLSRTRRLRRAIARNLPWQSPR